ncbi:MAG: threonine synthase [Bacteroidaceae bacterium]|nr:threonine synthase [Bacteroidaceae bacterium]MBQ8542306.1 threonine synthase [Bacteroidaceae bacterium]
MKYYSTNKIVNEVSLEEAVIKGLAADKGLFMPNKIKKLPAEFFENIDKMSFQEISFRVAEAFFGEDVPADALKAIVYDTLSFDTPVVHVHDNIYSLELFHGPTLAFKDVGGRFMARLLGYFVKNSSDKRVNVLVATSGDTGSAVANGFLGVEGVHVYVLYPKGKVSEIQEKQFTTLGRNITALEIEGCFDDCQALVKRAFMDEELNEKMFLTSANSINLARFLPQSFYYFYAYAQLKKMGKADNVVISVPSGNFGNITAGLFAQVMGLPVKRFIAANNSNDIFYHYLRTGNFEPKASVCTIANAMDVGNPSNFARILDLYGYNHENICNHISGATYSDQEIATGIKSLWEEHKYLLDPHGACGYLALKEQMQPGETGVFLETAHPAKFKDTIDRILNADIEIPLPLQEFMKGTKDTVPMSKEFSDLKNFLLKQMLYTHETFY